MGGGNIKYTLVFIIFLIPISAIAEIHGFFEVGKAFDSELTRAQIELQWWIGNGNLRNELYGGWETWFLFHEGGGHPFCDEYIIGNRIHYRTFYFQIEHHCNHPVSSFYSEGVIDRYSIPYLTTFSIGVKW